MDPRVHIRSGWKDAIGPELTDGAIRKYAKQGRYGEEFIPMTKKDLKMKRKEQRKNKERSNIEEFI